MKTCFNLLFVTLTATALVSCASPDDEDDDGTRAVTTERVGVDPYTGSTHTETTTRVVRED